MARGVVPSRSARACCVQARLWRAACNSVLEAVALVTSCLPPALSVGLRRLMRSLVMITSLLCQKACLTSSQCSMFSCQGTYAFLCFPGLTLPQENRSEEHTSEL